MARPSALLPALAVVGATLLAACFGDDSASDGSDLSAAHPDYNDPHVKEQEVLPDPLAGLSKGAEQLAKVCARGQRDAVTKSLCSKPNIRSIVDLQNALGIGFRNRSSSGENGGGGNPAFALLGHSNSLVARNVSAVNPHAFVFTPPPGVPARLPGYVVMGFSRGEQFVEIAAEDANSRKLTFYLFEFELACQANKTCTAGDVLTPGVEKDWQSYSLYDDEDLKNTIVDCRHCHQPDGPSSKKMLRMQELEDPWTHWLHGDRPGGVALLNDFLLLQGAEDDYAGIPGSLIHLSDGLALEDLVEGQGFKVQPNAFDSKAIEAEVKRSQTSQPDINTPMGKSATWQRLYDASVTGSFIPPPYHDVKVTDPDKLAFVTAAYQNFRAGALPKRELPDLRRVFLADALADMSLIPKKGATGKEVLVQACAQCHNPRLDSGISRAKFDATKLDAMSPAMKQAAIARMKLPESDIRHMPPAMLRAMPPESISAAVAELSK